MRSPSPPPRAAGESAAAPAGSTVVEDAAAIESLLLRALEHMIGEGCPPRLARALRHALIGGGQRFRPRLCYAVARATGAGPTALTARAATALELIHCASLVHDDLPCFDDAATRRGKPSVHKAFGEATAVLTGDALIFAAFDQLARAATEDAAAAGRLLSLLARAGGVPRGITAGQAWEQEPAVDVKLYHDTKTAVLFEAATVAGALSVGAAPEPWLPLGTALGRAYQLADDILDHVSTAEAMGKPVGRDAALNRPSAVNAVGLDATRANLARALREIGDTVPECPGFELLITFLEDFPKAFRKALVVPMAE